MTTDPQDLTKYTVYRTSSAVQCKLLDADFEEGTVEGYGAVFGNVDFQNETIEQGAFAESLAAHRKSGTRPPMLWSHLQSEPVGRWTELQEDHHGLHVRGLLNLASARGQQARTHLKAGDVSGLSVGFQVLPDGATLGSDGSVRLKRLNLIEVSVVACPANTAARIASIKSLGSERELVDILRSTGLARGASEKIARAGYKALTGTGGPDLNLDLDLDLIADRIDRLTNKFRTYT